MTSSAVLSRRTFVAALTLLAAAACGNNATPPSVIPDPIAVTGRVPLPELGINTYKGFAGGLYDDGLNTPPSAHRAEGIARRNAIVPLDAAGNPSASGRIVLLSVGMSNTTQEFCSSTSSTTGCAAFSFVGQAAADAQVNQSTLTLLNGARGGQAATSWDDPADPQYDTVRFNRLETRGLTEKQVQIAWVKLANPGPRDSLPGNADAVTLEATLGRVMRALKLRYQNLRMVFLSSRIYAGYATTTLNPEPFAYESGFSVKWLISAQARQVATGVVDQTAGSLDYRSGEAPWLAWGPYLWANGTTPRQGDGLTWVLTDLAPDGTHPSSAGVQKVGSLLLSFFKTNEFTSCWFLAGSGCQ